MPLCLCASSRIAEDEKARREDNGKEGNHPCTQNRYAISGREEGVYTIKTGGEGGGKALQGSQEKGDYTQWEEA
jgi:hypothetical protein